MPKIIQTFWLPKDNENPLLNTGGFVCPEIHYMSWAFSCLQLKKFYSDVELHTNQAGKEILIDLLGLPYTKVHLSLETEFMQNLLPDMWAYAKIHSYSLQKDPFLHVDGDVFIWKAFETELMQSPLIAQNLEDNLTIYHHSLDAIKKHANYIPDWINLDSEHPKAYNAGIIGGTAISFFKEYIDLAFEFYKKNKSILENIKNIDTNINTIPEQLLFYVLSKSKNIKINCFSTKNVNTASDFEEFVDFSSIPQEKQYFHLLGGFKRNKTMNDFVSFILKQEYPDYWKKIISLYEKKGVLSKNTKRYLEFQENAHKIITPQIVESKNIHLETKHLCKIFGLEFENELQSGFSNKIIKENYELNIKRINFNKKEFQNLSIKQNPFPIYKKETNLLNHKDFGDYYVFVSPYHEVIFSKYDWKEILKDNSLNSQSNINPYKRQLILYLDVNLFSSNELTINDFLFDFIEKLKADRLKLKDILKIYSNKDKSSENILFLIKTWYSYGFIYFSKSKNDFIPQEPSKIYTEHQNNLKTQIHSCLKSILTHYKIENYNQKLISQFNNSKKAISLHEIIKVLESLDFETKGVRGNLDSLNGIPLPAIALVKLRDYLPLYVIITKVTDTHVTIYNTEIKEEEEYQKNYFSTIWEGILILMIPKN
ncbi:DUF6734 family protein [Flavobacterium gawalongense]|uniref:Peptidase C39 domain-containing protein n=1 Tax=Flavobacterium gawalongense TaxID=2594432 RepID=A0A553BX58_9FLAO|nr:DUF6734 family protein [Flavobacterium gawalongense]TRX04172.1 hypothetical protein FNW33_01450 [Flavobacterium gawalongense]TRX09378.1 hypothetical protein FNW12_02820 [Flavobacterium gawalongense]TRX12808.1 hypothetical protein FNW11_01960 [Flavobacterium gawalongense]TRX13153.1 hypothetical protein FNW10_01955 [Flavobacterium gawalongense]TRX30785.1 hypothetical protein FNW38_03295 [Flavobacterium gawalongense]